LVLAAKEKPCPEFIEGLKLLIFAAEPLIFTQPFNPSPAFGGARKFGSSYFKNTPPLKKL